MPLFALKLAGGAGKHLRKNSPSRFGNLWLFNLSEPVAPHLVREPLVVA